MSVHDKINHWHEPFNRIISEKSLHNIQKEPGFLSTSLFGGGSLFWLWPLPILGFFLWPRPAVFMVTGCIAWPNVTSMTFTKLQHCLISRYLNCENLSHVIIKRYLLLEQSTINSFCMMNVFCAWNKMSLISLIRLGLINRRLNEIIDNLLLCIGPRQVDSLLEYCKCSELV